MPKRYPEECRRKVLDLVDAGRLVAQIAADRVASRRRQGGVRALLGWF